MPLNARNTYLNAAADFAGQPVTETGSVTINNREHNITVSRNFTYESVNQNNSYQFTTDGRELQHPRRQDV